MPTPTEPVRTPARVHSSIVALATVLLSLPFLAGCEIFGAPGLSDVQGTAPAYARLGAGAAEVRVVLRDAGIYGGRGTIDGNGAFTLDLDTGIDASLLPPVTDLAIGGADLFGVSISDRGARVEIGEIGVVVDEVGIGLLYLSNVDEPPSPEESGVVLATLIYSDRAVSLEGTAQGPGTTVRYNARIPRGWSYLVVRRGQVSADEPTPYTVTSILLDGMDWLYEPIGPLLRDPAPLP